MKESLTRTELWKVFSDSKPSRFKPPCLEKALEEVCTLMKMEKSEEIKAVLDIELKIFQRTKKEQKIKNRGITIGKDSFVDNFFASDPNLTESQSPFLVTFLGKLALFYAWLL